MIDKENNIESQLQVMVTKVIQQRTRIHQCLKALCLPGEVHGGFRLGLVRPQGIIDILQILQIRQLRNAAGQHLHIKKSRYKSCHECKY